MRAWFAGDLEECLDLCAAVRRDDFYTRSEVALLRARALLRLGRAPEVERVITDAFVAHGSLDASISARMLLGAAEIRLNRVDEGLERLTRLETAAATVHPTIRSEIALYRALAYYGRRDLAAAESAVDVVSEDADIIHARALELRGWIALARGQSPASVRFFLDALRRLDTCRRNDRFLQANCLYALATHAAETLDLTLWASVQRRSTALDWDASGLAWQRFWMRYYAVTLHECAGETIEAVRAAREAEALAPSPAYRVTARCRRAELASDIGETFAQYDHVLSAREIFTGLDLASLSGEERLAPLFLAEESARVGDAIRAREYLGIYRKHGLTSRMSTLVDDPRLLGYERLVEAFVARAGGNDDLAQAGLREAFRAYKPIGYRRLAVRAALGLAELTGQDYLFEYVHRETRDLAGSYWPRRHIRHRTQLYRDAKARTLTHVEREVLMLVCEGKSNREIAKVRGRSEQRIKNVVSGLFVAFDVKGRSKLIVECKRRGIPPEP